MFFMGKTFKIKLNSRPIEYWIRINQLLISFSYSNVHGIIDTLPYTISLQNSVSQIQLSIYSSVLHFLRNNLPRVNLYDIN